MKIRPTFTMIAGANGAGKSTYTKITGQNNFDVDKEFYKVKYKNPNYSEKKIQNEVDKKFNNAINNSIRNKKDFSMETDFRGEVEKICIAKFKKYGFNVNVIYIGLDNTEISRIRVEQRVKKGGHNIPNNTLITNFNKGIESIKKQLKSFDFIQFVDSDNNEFRKISELNLRTKELKNSTKAKLPTWYKQNFEPLVNSIKITQKRGPKL